MVEDIYNGVDTYLSLKSQYQSGDYSPIILSKLSDKCQSNHDPQFCEQVYTKIVSLKDQLNNQTLTSANLFFAKKDLDKGSTKLMLDLISSSKDPSLISDAYLSMINYYRSNNDTDSESTLYKKFSDNVKGDPSVLNGYAWRMTELGVNLEDALIKSDIAIGLSFDNPSLQSYILDTKAEILWLLGRAGEAVNAINLAIDIDSKSDYFIEQKNKFQDLSEE